MMMVRISLLVLQAAVFSVSAPIASSGSAGGSSSSLYPVFWSVVGPNISLFDRGQLADVTRFGILPGERVHIGNAGHYRPCGWECRNQAPAWGQGAFPSIGDDGTTTNGGVPQAANLSHHLALLAEQIPIFVADPDYSGLAVFDWEAWTPVWENNAHPTNYHGKRYSDLSVKLVKEAHPDWPDDKVNATAIKTFETAAVDFIVKTLELCTRMRPNAVWGFCKHATFCFFVLAVFLTQFATTHSLMPSDGMESSLEVGSAVMAPIYRASGALFPSIYISQAPATTEQRRATVLSQVTAAVNASARLAAGGGQRRVPVFPFAWECYHNGSTLLSYDDLQSEIIGPYEAGADGVVVWGCKPHVANPLRIAYA
eukprot:SAG31_NODE_8818_length_1382_cov_1.386594_1_plen_369_part_00